MLGKKELWCSFQPRQFSFQIATTCDQNDVQIYRDTCKGTGDMAWRMGITGNPKVAVAHPTTYLHHRSRIRCSGFLD